MTWLLDRLLHRKTKQPLSYYKDVMGVDDYDPYFVKLVFDGFMDRVFVHLKKPIGCIYSDLKELLEDSFDDNLCGPKAFAFALDVKKEDLEKVDPNFKLSEHILFAYSLDDLNFRTADPSIGAPKTTRKSIEAEIKAQAEAELAKQKRMKQ